MAFSDSSAGMIFRIKADSKEAIAALEAFKKEVNETEKAAQGAATPFERLGHAAGLSGQEFVALKSNLGFVTAGLGIMATATGAAVAALGTLFKLSSDAAEFGSAIYDASQKTGLTAESLSALKVAAEQSGSSFEEITGNVSKFNVLLGEANQGNEKARATLEQYGITATTTDKALEQAIQTIADMTSADQQAAAAKALFKDRTAAILPVIKSFDGDLPGLIKKLREMGLIMSDDAAKAADEFGDQIDTLKLQLAGIARTIGQEVMPIFLLWVTRISDWLKENQGAVRFWADAISGYLELVTRGWMAYGQAIQNAKNVFTLNWGELKYGLPELPQALPKPATRDQIEGRTTPPTVDAAEAKRRLDEVDKAIKEGLSALDKASKEATATALDRAARDVKANLEIELNNFQTQKEALKKEIDDLRDAFEKDGNTEKFMSGVADAFARAKGYFADTLKYIEQLENQSLDADTTQGERNLLIQKQLERRNELVQIGIELNKKNRDLVVSAADAMIAKHKEEAQALYEVAAARDAGIDAVIHAAGEPGTLGGSGAEGEEAPGIFDSWTASWENFFGLLEEQAPTLGSILKDMAGTLQNAFSGIAKAIGSVLEQWVLTGDTGPAVMRKVLAAALASIAAESAVRAIFELAAGFAALFINPAEASAHFTAAALFGSVAAGAAISGRAVAGDAFKRATGSASKPVSGSLRESSGSHEQGEVYSSQKKGVLTESRNEPAHGVFERFFQQWEQRAVATVRLKMDEKGFFDAVEENVKNNGKMRVIIQRA